MEYIMLLVEKKNKKEQGAQAPFHIFTNKLKNMSCSGGKSTKKGSYNKANNLKKPTGYTVDSKGNIKPLYK